MIDAVVKFPVPLNIKHLQEFAGMANYYHCFLPHIATTMGPLYAALEVNPKKLAARGVQRNKSSLGIGY